MRVVYLNKLVLLMVLIACTLSYHAHSEDDELYQSRESVTLDLKNSAKHIVVNSPQAYTIECISSVWCSKLVHVNLSACINLKIIGDNFLRDCVSLQSIILHPDLRVEEVGDYFLSGCQSLPRINLYFLKDITKINKGFLSQCYCLEEVDLMPLSRVTIIDSMFLFGCRSLQNLDVSPLGELVNAGVFFLAECWQLECIHMHFPKLQEIGAFLLFHNTSLTHVYLNLPQLLNMGAGFLLACLKLTCLDTSNLSTTQQNIIKKAIPPATQIAHTKNKNLTTTKGSTKKLL